MFKNKLIKQLLVLSTLGLLVLSGCSSTGKDDKVIRVGASTTPHAIILEAARGAVEAAGYTLEIVEFTDYILPNTTLDAGDLDANYFQHLPYLTTFNEKNNTKLTGVLPIHFEPLGIYPGKASSLEAIEVGNATIAIPNDPTNEARALALLVDLGYITLKAGSSSNATPLDIESNPYNIQFVEIEAALLVSVLKDVELAIINGNYALGGGVASSVIVTEDKNSVAAQTFANLLVVRIGTEESEKTKVLIAALKSESVKQFILDTFSPTVVPLLD